MPLGEWNGLVTQAGFCASAFIRSSKVSEGLAIYEHARQLSERVLHERPWDWYLRHPTMLVHFEVATALEGTGLDDMMQQLRRNGWNAANEFFQAGVDLSKYAQLPPKSLEGAEARFSANAEDAAFFSMFTGTSKSTFMRMYVIPCEVNGKQIPVQFYVVRGKAGLRRLLDQFHWLSEYRGVHVALQVKASFEKLHLWCETHNTDFYTMCVLQRQRLREKQKRENPADQPLPDFINYALLGEVPTEEQMTPPLRVEGREVSTVKLGNGAKTFTIPCLRGSEKAPVEVWMDQSPECYYNLLRQFLWVSHHEKLMVPWDILDSLEKLNDIAVKNNVSFVDLCTYALNYDAEKKAELPAPKNNSQSQLEGKPDVKVGVSGPQAAPHPDDDVVLVINGANSKGEKIYQFVKLKQGKVDELIAATKQKGFTLPSYAEVLSAGLGEPSEELKKQMEGRLTTVKLPDGSTRQIRVWDPVLPPKPNLSETLRLVEASRHAFAKDPSEKNRFSLANNLSSSAFSALFERRFSEAESWCLEARRLCSEIETSHVEIQQQIIAVAQGNLAHALLFQGKYPEALEIYRKNWNDRLGNRRLKDAVIEDFGMFERDGITHPDLPKMKKELGIDGSGTTPKPGN